MNLQTSQIQQNIETVQNRIQRAAQSVHRSADSVRLVVVTKAQPVDVVGAAIEAGARILGENYPEEAAPKIAALTPKIQALGRPGGVQWHLIGHLQSRKVGIMAENFDLLQSLDSARLAEKLERRLAEVDRALPVLLEMNVSGEESKFGFPAWEEAQWSGLSPEIEAILALPHLTLRGLMTMPPLYDDPEQTRPFFARLRRLSEFLARHYGEKHFAELSMGTSADYPAAVQEGATLVRIGTAIVGPRPKQG